ncbi:hypothetical protein MMC10_006274 [Thelotrema lepadinum]|nr:hypothetical protein [Thelotrema lepadinum]
MGLKEDQRLPSELALNEEGHPPPRYAPPLPPRGARDSTSRELSSRTDAANEKNTQKQSLWVSQDPRASSTDSLFPQERTHGKRTLLLIYIHGFLGDETSFQSFPAHVHNLATHLLSDSHVVHTKIYPKYKSRKAIEFARDGFSDWLRPHESEHTDVILLGHSMGGILSAEICLKRPDNPIYSSHLVHRILGAINFDVPFLGMHPGVIVSGLGSLFRPGGQDTASPTGNALMPMPAGEHDPGTTPSIGSVVQQPQMPGQTNSSASSYFPQRTSSSLASISQDTSTIASGSSPVSPLSVPVNDPNFNPRFENDVVRPVRKGWDNALYFVKKHAGELTHATKTLVTSHLEFGGTMADYKTLHERYRKIRALEDIDDTNPNEKKSARRVRFVNYYTASTGRPKQPKSPSTEPGSQTASRGRQDVSEKEAKELTVDEDVDQRRSRSKSPRVSVEDPEGRTILEMNSGGSPGAELDNEKQEANADEGLETMDPRAVSDDDHDFHDAEETITDTPIPTRGELQASLAESVNDNTLPPVTPMPPALPEFDASQYQDKDILKLAEKDYARKLKAHKQAVKDREKAIIDRQKIVDKREKKAKKEHEKALKADKRATEKEEKEKAKQQAVEGKALQASPAPQNQDLDGAIRETIESYSRTASEVQEKPKKDRKFCVLPSKGADGKRDPTWIRVYMEGVDEVGAHCGLFFPSKPHYQKFVSDVGAKIHEWIERDLVIRAANAEDA